jgi:hypothetical protein
MVAGEEMVGPGGAGALLLRPAAGLPRGRRVVVEHVIRHQPTRHLLSTYTHGTLCHLRLLFIFDLLGFLLPLLYPQALLVTGYVLQQPGLPELGLLFRDVPRPNLLIGGQAAGRGGAPLP